MFSSLMAIMMKPMGMMEIIVIVMEVKVARGISIIIIMIRVIVIPIGGVVSYTT